ncbi:hypothetical protein [uncultured Tenacibaculum sp.]|uniref:hypothetical protein n=1 Tax=uncultured Tenacibaculum sp. TaxID=174713 RepID=UPI00262BCA51|nr:hypothetical protein [uncultured Tenacibaculum sp.]
MKKHFIKTLLLLLISSTFYAQKSSYIPIDPLPVITYIESGYKTTNKDYLEKLPDETTKFSSIDIEKKASANYLNFVDAKKKNSHYEVIFDWIKYSSIHALAIDSINNKAKLILKKDDFTIITDQEINLLNNTDSDFIRETESKYDIVKIIMGVGIRMTAKIKVKKRNLSITDVFGLGAEASDGNIEGSIEINTLGITGESVTSLVPLPTEINKSTIQSLLSNVAAIREKIYTMERNPESFLKVQITPRVIGYENLSDTEYSRNQINTYLYQNLPFLIIKDESVPINKKKELFDILKNDDICSKKEKIKELVNLFSPEEEDDDVKINNNN